MADLYHERLDTIYDSLKYPETNLSAMEIARSLIEHIDLPPCKGDLKACIHEILLDSSPSCVSKKTKRAPG